MSLPAVVVCDPGVDDMLALMTLAGLGHVPDAVVATAGNVDRETAYRNAVTVSGWLGFPGPVARGADSALSGPYPGGIDPFHGPDGLGGTAGEMAGTGGPGGRGDATWSCTPAGLALVRGSVLATGPLTAVAQALRAGNDISRVTWMGGAVAVPGNVTAVAEFNAWMDPEAADEVLTGDVDVAVVPLDVTHRVPLTADDLSELGGYGPVGALAAQACRYIHQRDGVIFAHDATAVIAESDPDLFEWRMLSVRTETAGTHTRGMTVADLRPRAGPGPVRVAVDVDGPAVKRRMLQALRSLR